MKGLFGNMFDLNRDGKLDSLEMAMDYMALGWKKIEKRIIMYFGVIYKIVR